MKLNDQLNMIRDNIGTEQEISITYFVPDDKKSGGAYLTHSGIIEKDWWIWTQTDYAGWNSNSDWTNQRDTGRNVQRTIWVIAWKGQTMETKPRILYLKKILEERTDEEHPLSTTQLINILNDEYGISAHRTTVTKDIAALQRSLEWILLLSILRRANIL